MRTKIGFLCVLTLLLSASAQAAIYRFETITNTDPGNAAIGEAQAWVEVAEYDTGQVSFTFHNDGPEASSITDIYFDIKGFDEDSGSRRESFISDLYSVPVPPSLFLLGSGLLGFLVFSRIRLAGKA